MILRGQCGILCIAEQTHKRAVWLCVLVVSVLSISFGVSLAMVELN